MAGGEAGTTVLPLVGKGQSLSVPIIEEEVEPQPGNMRGRDPALSSSVIPLTNEYYSWSS
jgi:hypothetical protein